MFRELTKREKALAREECLAILEQEKRGVLSVAGDDGYPYGMPMNHYYCPDDGCVYFHAGRGGHRMDSVKRCDRASFCVIGEGKRLEGDWALTVESVILFGRIELVEESSLILPIATALSRKFTSDEAYIQSEIDQYAAETVLYRFVPAHMCGKRVREA